ncbi:xanthine dehydrogenase accessory protein XdhC [Georgenia sp. EYE_87]|uniref:xanthine dehydrogenase accessory protein XdhC n=1 Tax=Georgenia sp. EYE_87 TaxID=2853448 RepID=UPI00200564A6|nr:xanthine dehydrogenase accessory protein XdhC [Georgenia sp. EYE_87]MCK6209577.1 xanthine dehydrogenase accessory protein XdhC [Georgenia sp. EYE_87]
MDWLAALAHLRAGGLPGVLVTVTDVRGHAPREAGAKMVVAAEGTWDSIGGGNLEATVVDRARELLAGGAHVPERMTFALNEHVTNRHGNQCCGGEVSVLLEPLRTRATIAVFGVGHVGFELGRILARLPVSLHLVDSRADQVAAERLAEVTGPAEVRVHHAPAPEVVLRNLPEGSRVLVMTHDHAEDLILCDAALNRGDLAYVGLIGSRAKWARFRRRLHEAGHDDAAIDTITCPVGLPGLTGKAPAVIAVSVAADLVRQLERDLAPVGTGREAAGGPAADGSGDDGADGGVTADGPATADAR